MPLHRANAQTLRPFRLHALLRAIFRARNSPKVRRFRIPSGPNRARADHPRANFAPPRHTRRPLPYTLARAFCRRARAMGPAPRKHNRVCRGSSREFGNRAFDPRKPRGLPLPRHLGPGRVPFLIPPLTAAPRRPATRTRGTRAEPAWRNTTSTISRVRPSSCIAPLSRSGGAARPPGARPTAASRPPGGVELGTWGIRRMPDGD